MKLQDRVAIITGGGRGIGKAIACLFAREGARVVIVSRTRSEVVETVARIAAAGGAALGMPGDVSSRAHVEKVVEETLAGYGAIDILVNDAAVQGPIGPFIDSDWEDWVKNFEVNLFGTAMFCQAVLPVMAARGAGRIINLAGGGATSPRPLFSAYGVSKTAVVRFTETLAEELRGLNIQVNAIAPGTVSTRMLDEVLSAGESAGAAELAEAKMRKERGGTPPEVPAGLALFLASEEADGITGKLISAVWDPWQDGEFVERLRSDSDLAALRRVDNREFVRQPGMETVAAHPERERQS